MPASEHSNRTSFKKGQKPWNKIYASESERYLAHRDAIIRRTRAHKIKMNFGLSLDEYNAKKKAQGPLCAICGERMILRKRQRGTSGRSPVLDHGHVDGQVREFVHRNCNAAIGLLEEDPDKLRKAAVYLEKHNALK